MSSLWSTTKSAVNNGYGMSGFTKIGLPNPFYKPRPWGIPGIHPELLEKPPYSQDSVSGKGAPSDKIFGELLHRYHRGTSSKGGKTLLKGSPEAKARMAYLRSLRGHGKRRLCGSGRSYNNAALHGGDGFFSTLLESIGGTAMNAIKKLALETGASITELLSNPKDLIQKLLVFAPAAARAVKSFFSGRKSSSSSSSSKRREYLQMLKKYDPDLYEKKRMEALRRKQELERKRLEAMKRDYGDEFDMDDDYNFSKYNTPSHDINDINAKKKAQDNFFVPL